MEFHWNKIQLNWIKFNLIIKFEIDNKRLSLRLNLMGMKDS